MAKSRGLRRKAYGVLRLPRERENLWRKNMPPLRVVKWTLPQNQHNYMLTKTDAGRRMLHKVVKLHIFDIKLYACSIAFFQLIGVKSAKKKCIRGVRSRNYLSVRRFLNIKMLNFSTLHGERDAQNPYLTRAFFRKSGKIRLTSFPLAAYRGLTSFVPSVYTLWRVSKTT